MKINVNGKNIICIILIAMLLIFTTTVYAANDSFTTTLSADKSLLKRGDNITVTIAISDIAIESGEKGIGAYTAKLDFDSSVLEYVSTNGTDNWEKPFYQNTLILGNTSHGEVVNTAQNIGTITFKVKEDAKLGGTTIKLTNISASTAVTDVASNDSSVEIIITDANGSTGNGNVSGNGNGSTNGGASGTTDGTGNANGSTQNGTSGNNSKVSNTDKENLKDGKLPQTGYSNIALYVLLGISIIGAISFWIRIRLINKKIDK